MKKYLLALLAVPAMVMTSCSADEGTEPGGDSKPVVTMYSYAPAMPYNSDNDVIVRMATNNKVDEVYYLAEKADDVTSFIVANGEDAYVQHVIADGTKVDVDGVDNIDVTLTGMFGLYTISAVAVDGNKHHHATIDFLGLQWEDVVGGTYYFGSKCQSITGMAQNMTMLQVCTTDPKLYRFRDVYGTGYSMKINLLDIEGEDDGGKYTFFRVPKQPTAFTYRDFGTVFVQDVGYWQGKESFVTEGGYESGMYEDYSCFVCVNMSVSAGNIINGGFYYDEFVANPQ